MKLICDRGCGATEAWGRDPKDARAGNACATAGCRGVLVNDDPCSVDPGALSFVEDPTRPDHDNVLPADSAARKGTPLARGVLDYFPAALAAVAQLSQAGNDKHNPGEELHHARSKSSDHADCIMRHLVDRGTEDPEDGILHDTKVAWRALAMLQEELERRGAPKARGAR